MSLSPSDRIATRDLQEYNSVHVEEDDADLEEDRDNRGYNDHLPVAIGGTSRRSRLPYMPSSHCSIGCCVSFYLLSFLLLLIVQVSVLYYYRDAIVERVQSLESARNKDQSKTALPEYQSSASSMDLTKTAYSPSKQSYTIYYDPSVGQPAADWSPYNDPPLPPDLSTAVASGSSDSHQDSETRGYMQQPSIYNNSLVFLSEGDLYYTNLRVLANNGSPNISLPAMRLTSTVGNVLSPRIYQNRIAFTATYTGRRDVYFMDLARPGSVTTERLTYTSTSGIRSVAQLTADGVLFAAPSQRVSLPDVRLYLRHWGNQSVSEVPLAQAVDGVLHGNCVYFVRYKQSSRTVRYVGGTAEKLWVYCYGQDLAVPLTADYNGTSKSPAVATYQNQKYLLFMSDRSPVEDDVDEWRATSMNLWAIPLPTESVVYGSDGGGFERPVQITHVSCQFNGMALQEFTVDPVTNNVVLRVGADLLLLTSKQVERRVQGKVNSVRAQKLPMRIYSDFHEQQERQIMADPVEYLTTADVFQTAHGTTSLLATLRGQTWVLPVMENAADNDEYQGSGQNMPMRRYRVVPGSTTGGMMRVLTSRNVPLLLDDSPRRLAVILATDPLSRTAEHAFYLVETHADVLNAFVDLKYLPEPFLGGRRQGGSTEEGGLGSVRADSVTVSPCGRRLAWTDTDGRILVMTLPIYTPNATYSQLNSENEQGEPMDGTLATLVWSPGGRYLAVEHQARNQFSIITIVDCGDPATEAEDTVKDISLGRHVQATPSRFNSYRMVWGKTSFDFYLQEKLELFSLLTSTSPPADVATTLYFLTDRDIISDVGSPWGSRAPSPHFTSERSVWALPLTPEADNDLLPDSFLGRFAGGGALELFVDDLNAFKRMVEEFEMKADEVLGEIGEETRRRARNLLVKSDQLTKRLRSRKLRAHEAVALKRFLRYATKSPLKNDDSLAGENRTKATVPNTTKAGSHFLEPADDVSLKSLASPLSETKFPSDMIISFGPTDNGLSFARGAYRMTHIPKAKYIAIVTQTQDDGSLVIADVGSGVALTLFSPDSFPSDKLEQVSLSAPIDNFGMSTCGNYVWIVLAPEGKTKVFQNTLLGWSSLVSESTNIADTSQLALSVLPHLEYRQMFNDAWRMLRDYFYDTKMHGIDWLAVHERYSDLVGRCMKREELDDVLAQMASELSALHVFVYGGEYNSPIDEKDQNTLVMVTPGCLGANLIRDQHWKGYRIVEIPLVDPDFNLLDNAATFSPLSDRTLSLTGQKGLAVGDVIVAINGESVMEVSDIQMLLRGYVGRTVRLEVLRLGSGSVSEMDTESVITTTISPAEQADLLYNAWEWRTRETAKQLAADAGFSVAYIHLRSMLRNDIHAFARGFFPDYDAQALILDVRHNNGGNIDSWILTFLQRQAWMYWQGRTGMRRGDLDWDAQFAFRGHIVVLIDEMTASDGEGVSRGISELGLGRLIGTRTWGGGIWLQSDNILVDGGIATAPEIGTFNGNFGWGLGIEQHGVVPDLEVDNNPRSAYDAVDTQLQMAIQELERWLKEEPVVIPNPPKRSVDMSLHGENCPA